MQLLDKRVNTGWGASMVVLGSRGWLSEYNFEFVEFDIYILLIYYYMKK